MWLRDVVSYDDKTFVPWKRRFVINRVSMVDLEGRFPRGCAGPALQELAASEGKTLVYHDLRKRPTAEIDESIWDTLPDEPFEFQVAAARTVLEHGMGIIKADPGAGKSLVAAMIVGAMPIKWLVLVHKDNLVHDLAKTFAECGIECTTHTSKKRKWGDVTIATFSSLTDPKYQGPLAGYDGLLVDECHNSASPTASKVISAVDKAYYRIGLSGTPLARSDSKNVVVTAQLGDIVFDIDAKELVDIGRTAACDVNMVSYYHKVSTKIHYSAIYREVIVNNKDRNGILARIIAECPKPCFVFTTQLEQIDNVAKLVAKQAPDIMQATVHGATPLAERPKVIGKMNDGLIDVIYTNQVLQEGVNVPSLGSVVFMGAGKAAIQSVQRLGRGARVTDGKTSFQLWDIHDHGIEMFYKQSRVRIKLYRSRGNEPTVHDWGHMPSNYVTEAPW